MMKTGLKLFLLLVMTLGLGGLIWWFTRKGQNVEKTEDPYLALRQSTGPYAASRWKGEEKHLFGEGYWVVLGQDFPEANLSELHGTAHAFIKGYDIMPTAAELRATLQDDLMDFIAVNGHMSPIEVIQGEFINL